MSIIFISHAHVDAERARGIAIALQAQKLAVRLDSSDLQVGSDFVAFIEQSLEVADYCLLLWSAHSAVRPWVAVEWHAALARSVNQDRPFLLVGRLDDTPLPTLLKPRLACDLRTPGGLEQLVRLVTQDALVTTLCNKPVTACPEVPAAADDPDTVEVFITSEFWGRVLPIRVALAWPVALVVRRVVDALGLPATRALDEDARTCVAYQYSVATADGIALDARGTLRQEGVLGGDLLELRTSLSLLSNVSPATGPGSSVIATYRTAGSQLPESYRERRAWLTEDAARSGVGALTKGG